MLSAVSHSSHSTSRTAGRPSSDTSTRASSKWTTCICSVLTKKFWSFPQLGHVRTTRVSSLIANTTLLELIVGDGICRRNAESDDSALVELEFAVFPTNPREIVECVNHAGVDRGSGERLPHGLQIEVDLRQVLGTFAPGPEFEQRQPARSGLDEAIHGSAQD